MFDPHRAATKNTRMQNKSVPPALVAALGREPEQPLHSAINSHEVPSTKTNLQNKSVGADDLCWSPLEQMTLWPLGGEPSERRFTLTCTQCTIGWSSLTRFNAQIYEVGC